MRRAIVIVAILLLVLHGTLRPTLVSQFGTETKNPDISSLLSVPPATASIERPISTAIAAATQPLSNIPDHQVTSDPSFEPQNEPSIAINPLNTNNTVIGANDYRLAASGGDAWEGVYTSNDTGQTWANNLIPGYPGGPANVLTGFQAGSDPALAFDSDGTLYFAGIVFNRRGTGAIDGTVFVSRSTDGGLTFPQTVIVAQGHRSNPFNDKSYIAVDRSTGIIYVTWTRFTSTASILVSRSTNRGATWSVPITLSDTLSVQGSIPAAEGGRVYVAWYDFVTNSIKVSRSNDGGLTFSTPRIASSVSPLPSPLPNSLFRVNSFPSLSLDRSDPNKLTIAWGDYRSGNADILDVTSADGGLTWSLPVRVNDDATLNDQFFPWLAIDSGIIHVTFYDRRDDPANHNLNVYYAASTNSGVSFQPNQRLADVASDPDLGFGGQFIGDYIGLAVERGHVHAAWTDMRNAVAGTATRNNQDIFTEGRVVLRDLTVLSVTPSRTVAYSGATVHPVAVNVTVQNNGNLTEAFTVSAFANASSFSSVAVSSLGSGSAVTLTLEWDTSTLALGNYNITAQASPVQGESHLDDNAFSGGLVQVRKAGDVDGDGDVDVDDLISVFVHQFTQSRVHDIDNDGDVDVNDLIITYSHEFS